MLAAGYIDDTTTRNNLVSAVHAHAVINQSDIFPLVYDSVSGKTITGRSRYAIWLHSIVSGLIYINSIKVQDKEPYLPL
jgi:ABC-type oligopeptide transport system ATPase subunit